MGDSEISGANFDTPVSDRLDQDELAWLLAEVRRTHAVEHELQQQPGGNTAHYLLLPARRQSLAALEAYADAVGRHGWPLPPRMRMHLQLLRSICGGGPKTG